MGTSGPTNYALASACEPPLAYIVVNCTLLSITPAAIA
jgi:hypothetical protein